MIPSRPRVNQPRGFRSTGGYGPSYYYGQRHEYIFFPLAWTDEETGTYYEKGYYDENGQRYDTVSFEKAGRYENVVCHCAYCGQDTIMNLSAAEVTAQKLECPNCGASLEIRSALDTYQNGINTSVSMASVPVRAKRKKKVWPVFLVIVAILGGLYALGSHELKKQELQQEAQSWQGTQSESFRINDEYETMPDFLSQDTIYLSETGGQAFAVSDSPADKELIWDEDAESYYDEESDCWLWYNMDVDPPLWQYWYEGISSDFGDYGWMEHDADGWFIEESYGNWIELPEEYDTGSLWYIEE